MAITKEELKEVMSPKIKVEKKSTITSDGYYLTLRVPQEIVNYKKIKKGDKIIWTIEEEDLKIEYIKNEK